MGTHLLALVYPLLSYPRPHPKQYTHIIELMDAGELPLFNHIIPPPIAMSYWKLGTWSGWVERLSAREAGWVDGARGRRGEGG
jgi:hypothetical protein